MHIAIGGCRGCYVDLDQNSISRLPIDADGPKVNHPCWFFSSLAMLLETEMNKENRPEDKNDTSIASKGLERKVYEKELERLHVELVKLQEWVKTSGAKICILFEGRDGAGKGGSAPAHFMSLPCPPRRNGRNPKCIFSGTSATCRQGAKS